MAPSYLQFFHTSGENQYGGESRDTDLLRDRDARTVFDSGIRASDAWTSHRSGDRCAGRHSSRSHGDGHLAVADGRTDNGDAGRWKVPLPGARERQLQASVRALRVPNLDPREYL